jgi:hypothetical protein
MSINGIDVTGPFSIVCGTIWTIVYFSFMYLVIRFRPKNINQRRWKASLLVGGLPVLGMPLVASFMLFGIMSFLLFSERGEIPKFQDFLPILTGSLFGMVVCTVPLSVLLAIPATIGSYQRLTGAGKWLNTIVPPEIEEKPDVHEYL